MRTFKFERESDGRWYVVLPEWQGDKEELEMVAGADMFLEIMAQGENEVVIDVDIEPFDGFKYKLTFQDHEAGGGTYYLRGELFEFPVWLCHVTEFVYGYLPENIFVR
ncbi:MAG: hypothetical protein GY827_04835 [Cytophagales bacterium]|nr:hypothetical protein [Cytophagales bacterium]